MAARSLAALVLLGLAASASAQDGSEATSERTVEGAQQFLTEFYAQADAKAKSGGYVRDGHWSVEKTPGSIHQMIEGPVVGVATTGRCKSTVTVHPAIEWRWRRSDASTPVAADSGRLSLGIDWSAIQKVVVEDDWLFEDGGPASVKTGYTSVILWVKAPGQAPGQALTTMLIHPTREGADRAAFAMQFLAEHCGFKSDTGF